MTTGILDLSFGVPGDQNSVHLTPFDLTALRVINRLKVESLDMLATIALNQSELTPDSKRSRKHRTDFRLQQTTCEPGAFKSQREIEKQSAETIDCDQEFNEPTLVSAMNALLSPQRDVRTVSLFCGK